MQLEQQEQQIYARKYNSVESALPYFSAIKNKPISWMFLWCKADIREVILNAPDDYIVRLENKEQPVFTIQISQIDEEDEKVEEIHALCLPSELHTLFMVASDSKFAVFKRLMNRIINYNYPLLSRVFLKNSEIKQLFFRMHEKYNIRIMVYRLSYSRISETMQEKDIRWTRKLYDEVFEELEDASIKRIDFRALIEKAEKSVSRWIRLFECGIARDCYFKVKGDFGRFYQYIVNVSIKMIANRLGYLEERSESAKERLPEPVVIRFNNPIFKEKDNNEKFIQKLEELKNISIMELHTNPYLHISLLDYDDGSSYGIWIVSENEINIIPQIRATVPSMTRLLNHIYQKVQEGETTRYALVEVTEAD